MQLRVKLFFLYDIFDIERMIEDKMICSGFLCYSINTNLPFKASF